MTEPRRLSVCPACGGSGIRPPDGEDSMGLPRWGPEGMDNRVDRRCRTCRPNEASAMRPVGIQEFVILDVDERTGPPAQPLLRVTLLPGKTVSLAIEKYDETHDTKTYKRIAQVVVDLEPLYNAIAASVCSEGWKPRD